MSPLSPLSLSPVFYLFLPHPKPHTLSPLRFLACQSSSWVTSSINLSHPLPFPFLPLSFSPPSLCTQIPSLPISFIYPFPHNPASLWMYVWRVAKYGCVYIWFCFVYWFFVFTPRFCLSPHFVMSSYFFYSLLFSFLHLSYLFCSIFCTVFHDTVMLCII